MVAEAGFADVFLLAERANLAFPGHFAGLCGLASVIWLVILRLVDVTCVLVVVVVVRSRHVIYQTVSFFSLLIQKLHANTVFKMKKKPK